ncbi:plastid transcriptionally active [Trifolium repens]|nr:plastid transcriptionally active [Trifolium repens]
MASSLPLYQSTPPCFFSKTQFKGLRHGYLWRPKYSFGSSVEHKVQPVKAVSVEAAQFPLLQPPKVDDSAPELEPVDPDFYRIGYVRSMRAYGVDFKEGPNGFGVYASKDVEPLRRPRVIMEIPLELMLTISKKLPWMFFPDIIPLGHPIFDIINSTNPEYYGDFLPSADESTSLLLSTEEELLELQDPDLASKVRIQQQRALEFWEKNWHSGVPLKVKRLAREPERMLEVLINAGQQIRKGDEMTVDYMSAQKNDMLMLRYGFSSPVNPWDAIKFSGNARIHLDSFLSVFNISGLREEYYRNEVLSNAGDTFVDGAVIAAARTLPTWSDGDVPPIPSEERKAVKALQQECKKMLAEFATTSKQDQKLLVGIAQSRCINMQMRMCALTQEANMLIPYADMLNHSFEPNCFFHWRFKDRMLEVLINAGQQIRKGDEMTVDYMSAQKNDMLMLRYGFSSPVNPWDAIKFSGNARIHLDSFLSVFNISGLPEEYYRNEVLSNAGDTFVDGAVIAAARTLPTWSDGDVPPIPSEERKAVKALQQECKKMLAEFATTSKQDQKLLDASPEARRTLEAAIKYVEFTSSSSFTSFVILNFHKHLNQGCQNREFTLTLFA